MTNAVAEQSIRYKELAVHRKLTRTLMGGTAAMREAAEIYLPKHPGESVGNYDVRLGSTTLFNAFEQAVSSQVGKLFSKPIAIADDMPERLVELAEVIDMQGRSLNAFARDLFTDAFIDGVAYILVDQAQMEQGTTAADMRARGVRPYAALVRADDLIAWPIEIDNGRITVSQVRIRQDSIERDGRFGERMVKRIKVLEPGFWQLYEEIDNQYTLVEEGESSLPFIPIVPVYTNRKGLFEAMPTLMRLAELNLEHWQSTSEQRHALTMQRFGMLAGTGIDPESWERIVVGPSKKLGDPNENARIFYVEPSGVGINLGFQDLEAIERRMQSVGMELRIEQGGQITATSAAIDSAEANAALKSIAEGLKDSLEIMFMYMAMYLGIPPEQSGSIIVNTDFDLSNQFKQGLDIIDRGRARHDISQETYWAELKRRGEFAEDFDSEVEKERLAQEMPQPLDLGL